MKRLTLLAGLFCSSLAQATVTVSDCVIREPAPGTDKTALYFTTHYVWDTYAKDELRLPSDKESLYGGRIPELAGRTELHDMKMVDGVMKMQRIPQILLKHGDTAVLKPGGKHVMLLDLKKRPLAGETYPVEILLAYDVARCDAVVKTTAEIQGAL